MTEFLRTFRDDKKQPIELEPAPGSEPDRHDGPARFHAATATFPSAQRFFGGTNTSPYVIDVPLGAGHVICGASDRLLSNAYLGKGDNLAIVLRLLTPGGQPPRHLFFEESHHGFSAVYAIVRLLGHPGVRFAGMLAAARARLRFWRHHSSASARLIPLHRETGRSTLEFVDSIADLYLRADLRNDTMKYLFIETHQQVLHRLNLPPTASHELIASRLQQANPHLPKWKKLAQRFDSRDYMEGLPPSGWLRVARELIEIKSAMA